MYVVTLWSHCACTHRATTPAHIAMHTDRDPCALHWQGQLPAHPQLVPRISSLYVHTLTPLCTFRVLRTPHTTGTLILMPHTPHAMHTPLLLCTHSMPHALCHAHPLCMYPTHTLSIPPHADPHSSHILHIHPMPQPHSLHTAHSCLTPRAHSHHTQGALAAAHGRSHAPRGLTFTTATLSTDAHCAVHARPVPCTLTPRTLRPHHACSPKPCTTIPRPAHLPVLGACSCCVHSPHTLCILNPVPCTFTSY